MSTCVILFLALVQKKKIEIFDVPDIRTLIKDPHFIESMNDVEARVRASFKSVIQNFLGNRKANNYDSLLMS